MLRSSAGLLDPDEARRLTSSESSSSGAVWGHGRNGSRSSGQRDTCDAESQEQEVLDSMIGETSDAVAEAPPWWRSSSQWKVAVAGGVSGVVSKTFTAPLSRLTILYQVRGSRRCRWRAALRALPERARPCADPMLLPCRSARWRCSQRPHRQWPYPATCQALQQPALWLPAPLRPACSQPCER